MAEPLWVTDQHEIDIAAIVESGRHGTITFMGDRAIVSYFPERQLTVVKPEPIPAERPVAFAPLTDRPLTSNSNMEQPR